MKIARAISVFLLALGLFLAPSEVWARGRHGGHGHAYGSGSPPRVRQGFGVGFRYGVAGRHGHYRAHGQYRAHGYARGHRLRYGHTVLYGHGYGYRHHVRRRHHVGSHVSVVIGPGYTYRYAAPPVVVVDERTAYFDRPPPPPPPETWWYYCQSAAAYYPDVPECPEPWVKVPPTPEPDAR